MTDREVMHKLLDKILDTGEAVAIHTEFFPGIPGEIPAVQKTYTLEIAEASYSVTNITRADIARSLLFTDGNK